MTRLTPRRLAALFLGLWVACAPVLFAIPAAAMTLQPAMGGDAGPGGCDGCPDTDADGGVCALMCLNAALFAITMMPERLAVSFDGRHEPARHPALAGRLATPDPAPPKSAFLL